MPIIANIDVDFRLPNTGGAIARPLDEKIGESISVLDFGAVGDGVADDTAALQAAIDHGLAVGGELVIPRSSIGYRTTATLRAGEEVMTDSWEDIVTRTSPITTWDTNINLDNYRANAANCRPLSIRCQDAIILPDFEPDEPTPVIEWNPVVYAGQGSWTGRCLIAPPDYLFPEGGGTDLASILAALAGGADPTRRYFGPLNRTRPTNNLIGFAIPQLGLQELANMHFAGLQYGLVSHGGYDRETRNLRADDCDEAFHFSVANSNYISNLFAFYCFKGVVFDGGASEIRGINCQSVVEEMHVLASESCVFARGYWEDAWEAGGDAAKPGQASGVGKFALKVGNEEDPAAGQIIATSFEDIRVYSNRPDKDVARIWGAPSGVDFRRCRNYYAVATGNAATVDNTSMGRLDNCDGDFVRLLPEKRFLSTAGINGRNAFNSDTSTYTVLGRFNYTLPAHSFGSIAAGATAAFLYTLPETIPVDFATGGGYCKGWLRKRSGGDDKIIAEVIDVATTSGISYANVRVWNPTSGAVTHDTAVYDIILEAVGDAFA